MAKFENTGAIIVDVRNCPGGSGDTVAYLASYFFGPEPRVLMRRHHRPSNTSRDTTVVEVDGKTGKSFEGAGVQPDIAVPANRALETARAEALCVGVRRP